jgi:solute carrier family 35 protein F5
VYVDCLYVLGLCAEFMQNILADDSYSHPFFITYVNTSFFIVFLIVVISRRVFGIWSSGNLSRVKSWRSFLIYIDLHGTTKEAFHRGILEPENEDDEEEDGPDDTASIQQRQGLLRGYREDEIEEGISVISVTSSPSEKLGLKATARLAAQFCLLWFAANYFALACLQYTTVGSTTILTSTSGVWTLIFGAFIGVEKFTVRKCLGVLASLTGVILISRLDMSSSSNDDEIISPPTLAVRGADGNDGGGGGSFPNKTPAEIALGDAMAAFSAIIYGIYTIVMKKQVGDESRVNMQLFFGLVGFFNVFFLWPGFIILHLMGIERFSLPSEDRIWVIILVCLIHHFIAQKKY